eukprot:TRINITY_DN2048_c0_g1_i1.p1 TRINITY_DN2048_c0_g1~~TRINITY_DN2048_c0_g1_i1.p1  ORF type:complete len:378 (-),score=57.19 TRINITY_DN2048_c0_g1_i1:414-1526(-)
MAWTPGSHHVVLNNVKWQFLNARTNQWIDFPKRTSVIVEKHFTNISGGKPCYIEHGDAEYKIDFTDGRAVDTRNYHKWLDIRRIDIDGRQPQPVQPAPPSPARSEPQRPAPQVHQPQPVPHEQRTPQRDLDDSFEPEDDDGEVAEPIPQAFSAEGIAPCKLYLVRGSVNCIGPWILLCEGNVVHTLVDVDLSKNEQYNPSFLALNPRHQVPVLDDEGFAVWESNTILRYICNSYTLNDSFYPVEARLRARVDMALDWRATRWYGNVAAVAYPILGYAEPDREAIQKGKAGLKEDFQLLEKFWLADGRAFINGDEPSIADIAIVLPLFYLDVTDVHIPQSIQAYRKRLARALQYFPECTRTLVQQLNGLAQ